MQSQEMSRSWGQRAGRCRCKRHLGKPCRRAGDSGGYVRYRAYGSPCRIYGANSDPALKRRNLLPTLYEAPGAGSV